MISRIKLLSIFFISFLITNTLQSQVAFFKFKDKSSYKGNWNLSYDIPDFLSRYFREKFQLNIISPQSIESLLKESGSQTLYELLISKNYEYLINGTITEFSINRLIAGEPKVAQYETYSNNIEIEFEIIELKSNRIIFLEKIDQKSSDLGIGITIFGKETETKKEFNSLNQIKFGSDEFLRTLVGKNLLQLCEKFSSRFEKIINLNKIEIIKDTSPSKTKSNLKRKIITGEILFIDDDTKEVFINLGKKDNLQVGMILPIYAEGDTIIDKSTGELIGITDKKIGEIEIIEVRGDRFSLGLIKEEKEKITKGNKIRKIEVSPE